MGICASSQYTNKGISSLTWSSATIKVIHADGRLQEFKQPIRARHVLSANQNYFLCNSESIFVDSCILRVGEDDELQLGQIYFVMPLSKLGARISLKELCELAVKASSAVAQLDSSRKALRGFKNNYRLFGVPIRFEMIEIKSPTKRDNQRIQL
ncbi:uncharacterized protein LOC110813706 [Carica papaya]|uniref:uncharacterized protein LOC110813706 n=1 Tax=Carica papaya TaxID=3649 RepID=UPI000B8D095D|nr:uncharacterized protein LOC110813706 [Carica papaya]